MAHPSKDPSEGPGTTSLTSRPDEQRGGVVNDGSPRVVGGENGRGHSRRSTYKAVSALLAFASFLLAASAIVLMMDEGPVEWEDREYSEGNLTISSGLHIPDISMGV